jgi:hypothetical protein
MWIVPSPLENAGGMILSVLTSVIVAYAVNILQLSEKYRRYISLCKFIGDVHSAWQIVSVLPIYPPCKHLN